MGSYGDLVARWAAAADREHQLRRRLISGDAEDPGRWLLREQWVEARETSAGLRQEIRVHPDNRMEASSDASQ